MIGVFMAHIKSEEGYPSMHVSLLLGLLLFIQQLNAPDRLTITNEGRPIAIINRHDFLMPLPDVPIIDTGKYNQFLEQLDQLVTQEPKNAALDQNGKIIPEHLGYKLHRREFTRQFYSGYFIKGSENIEIPRLLIYPKVDSELLGNIRSKRIGRYVTSFDFYNRTRTNNIKLATNAINNTVIFPGERFSFNKVVGKRTAGKGYLRAPVIIRGEFSEDIGGGICQVSSTLFNAVDNAGLQIVQRFSHSRKVSYIPPGRDATVSWYGPDFVFKNKYNQPILIQAKTLGNKLIIKLFSSDVIEYNPREVPNPPY
jgi:vancomycin resistance protein YoaR